jgi:hypothetical protein
MWLLRLGGGGPPAACLALVSITSLKAPKTLTAATSRAGHSGSSSPVFQPHNNKPASAKPPTSSVIEPKLSTPLLMSTTSVASCSHPA